MKTTVHRDRNGDVAGIVGGSGILLIQACALLPGLLPCLLFLGVFAIPLIIPALAIGLIAGVPVGLLWVVRRAARLVSRASARRARGERIAPVAGGVRP